MTDIQESLLTEIYTLLTEDDDLQEAMGGTVRLYKDLAISDADFPYLVHSLDLRSLGDFNIEPGGTYVINIYSKQPNAKEVLDIKECIMALLDNQASSTDETSDYRIWWQTDGPIPETIEIQHHVIQFNLRYLNDAQIGAILKR